MKMQPAISIILPCYNKAHVLAATLRALEEQTVDRTVFEVIVVDDGSTDSTPQVVTTLEPSYPLRFESQRNQGAGAARNLGASLAEGDVLLFLDADIILDSEALATHLDAHREYERVLVSSRILPLMPNPVGLEDLIFQETFDFGAQKRQLSWQSTITQCLSVNKEHFCQIGRFRTDLPRGQDIEFGYRATRAGFEILYCPEAIGRHNHAVDIGRRCEIERKNHRYLAALFGEHPHLGQDMHYLRYKWPVYWQQDSPALIALKLARHSLAWRPILSSMEAAWNVLKRTRLPLPMMKTLYWSIVGSYQVLGLRDGVRTYKPAHPERREERYVRP